MPPKATPNKTEEQAELVYLTFRCPIRGRNVQVLPGHVSWRNTSADCELCGSHGQEKVSFSCPCGAFHEVILKEW